MKLIIAVEPNFELEKAVCNYGFFMLSPNQWHPSTKSLQRPLRCANRSSSVTVSISQQRSENRLLIDIPNVDSLDVSDQEAIKRQIIRMLRITKKDDDDVRKFQAVHAGAKKTGFGRLFRSPDMFEDIVKAILLCNATWQRTLQMSQALCELKFEVNSVNHDDDSLVDQDDQLTITEFFRKRKRETTSKTTIVKAKTRSNVTAKHVRNFPTSAELASISESILKTRCKLGYRAQYIINVARMVEDRKLNLEEFERDGLLDKTLSQKDLKKIGQLKGFGPFSTANLAMCLGDYRCIPIDSETIKHLREVHEKKDCTKNKAARIVKDVYDKYAPYQCLAYWWEHCEFYEKQLGKEMSKLSPEEYHKVSGSFLTKNTQEEQEKTQGLG